MPTKKLPSIQSPTPKESKEETQTSSSNIEYATNERVTALEAKVNALIAILNSNPNVTSNCPKDSEGNRRIDL